MRTPLRIALAIAALIMGAAIVLAVQRRPHLPAAERGRRLAERSGCFACHGPEGVRGEPNPGRVDRTVPTWEGDAMMYAKSAADIRAWIHDGTTPGRRASRSWRAEREKGALRMPAFGRRFTAREVDDLVALVRARAGDPAPEDSLAAAGLARAEALGCTGCHGPGGKFARPNPGSFKGYVPSWDGADFGELVRSREEFGEWVGDGVSRRFGAQPAARFFLERAALRMPAYRDHLASGDVEALWTYVTWLRARPSGGGAPDRP